MEQLYNWRNYFMNWKEKQVELSMLYVDGGICLVLRKNNEFFFRQCSFKLNFPKSDELQ
jgi:hypothetical protein